jgi:hypothetical protein
MEKHNPTYNTIYVSSRLTPKMFDVLYPYMKKDIYLKYNDIYYVVPLNSGASSIALTTTTLGTVPKLKYL